MGPPRGRLGGCGTGLVRLTWRIGGTLPVGRGIRMRQFRRDKFVHGKIWDSFSRNGGQFWCIFRPDVWKRPRGKGVMRQNGANYLVSSLSTQFVTAEFGPSNSPRYLFCQRSRRSTLPTSPDFFDHLMIYVMVPASTKFLLLRKHGFSIC